MDLGIAGVAAITVICLLVGKAAKNIDALDNKWIPTICGTFGLVLGIVGLYIMPDFPADNLITAAAIGVVSGLGATGVHQAVTQFME